MRGNFTFLQKLPDLFARERRTQVVVHSGYHSDDKDLIAPAKPKIENAVRTPAVSRAATKSRSVGQVSQRVVRDAPRLRKSRPWHFEEGARLQQSRAPAAHS